ncbi:MAG: GNAT family N-acetyltransferase [Promethearchaeota archaeon]
MIRKINNHKIFKVLEAGSNEQLKNVRRIFKDYSNYLNIDLEFQDFEEELNNLPGEYKPPLGCILLAFYNNTLIGCVALRKFEEKICEMKRLYVKPQFRSRGFGKNLAKAIINKAIKIGYKSMRLDTLPFMKEAISLYKSLGFKEMKPYRYNPFKGAKFFELEL